MRFEFGCILSEDRCSLRGFLEDVYARISLSLA